MFGNVLSSLFSRAFEDGNDDSALRLQISSTHAIRSVCFFPDNSKLVTGSTNRSVCIYDVQTGKLLNELLGHDSEINSVDVSSSGRYIVSGGDDRHCIIWDAITGNQLHNILSNPDSMVYSLVISKDETKFVVCFWDATVRIFDFPNPTQEIAILRGHTHVIMSIDLDAKGLRAISGSWDTTIRVWNLKTLQCEKVLQGHTGECNAVALSADGTICASGGDDQIIFLWDITSGQILKKLIGHSNFVVNLTIRATNYQWALVSGSWDGTCRFYKSTDEDNTGVVVTQHHKKVIAVDFSAQGTCVASASFDKTVIVTDLYSGDRHRLLTVAYVKNLPVEVMRIIKSMMF